MTTETKESEDHRRRIFDRRRRVYTGSTSHYTIVDYYPVWNFFADAEQPWTAARRRRVPDDGSHSVFDGVIGSLLNGLPSWSTTLPLPWTTLNGLRTNWIPSTPLSFILLFPDDLHELFNCLTVCYYHTHLIGYAALLVTLFASFAPSVYFISC